MFDLNFINRLIEIIKATTICDRVRFINHQEYKTLRNLSPSTKEGINNTIKYIDKLSFIDYEPIYRYSIYVIKYFNLTDTFELLRKRRTLNRRCFN